MVSLLLQIIQWEVKLLETVACLTNNHRLADKALILSDALREAGVE